MGTININEKLPENLEWYKNQIAGHHPSVIRNGLRQIGIIKERGSKQILKMVQEGVRGEREIAFYEKLKALNDRDSAENTTEDDIVKTCLKVELQKLLPKYYGRRHILIGNKEIEFLCLEDVINSFQSPCIMDIKIGRVTYDPLANEEKKRNESMKCGCQTIFGFRILGYRINSEQCDEPRSRDRVWGKFLTEDVILEAFEEYLFRGRPHDKLEIVERFISRIKLIKEWFERQTFFHFYASSLLLVYEGENLKSKTKLKVDIRMIDFSHVFHADSEHDLNYAQGVNYIFDAFNKIREKIICEAENTCKQNIIY